MLEKVLNLAENIEDYRNGEIKRYNGKHKIKEENIAEHSFMLAMNIIRVCKIMDIDDDIRNESVTLAILHDISEKYVGDIAYEFKSDMNNKRPLEVLFDNYEDMLYDDIYRDEIGEIYKSLGDNSLPDRLVKLGDSMACVQFSTREISLGNKTNNMQTIHEKGLGRVKYDYKRLLEVL